MTAFIANLELAQRVENHFFMAWPAMAEMTLDGWSVRLSGGYSDRANCVTPRNPGTQPVLDKVMWAERFYNDRRLPTLFRISDLCPETSLDEWLNMHGYKMSWALETATCDLTKRAPVPQQEVQLYPSPTHEWIEAAISIDSRIAATRAPFTFITQHMPKPSCFAQITVDHQPAAIGAATVHNDLMGIFLMRTHQTLRRQGYARRILNALLLWGADRGAHIAWLQFDRDHETATGLYRGAGFQPLYHYHYRKQPMTL